jgi:hypothetical protein
MPARDCGRQQGVEAVEGIGIALLRGPDTKPLLGGLPAELVDARPELKRRESDPARETTT